MPATNPLAVQMAGITKVFDTNVVANADVALNVRRGTVHALVGENGAGKTTLANVLYGRYRPDSGRVRIHGSDVELRSPADAIRHGIGMVTQHTTLIPALSLLDNMLLGQEMARFGILRRSHAAQRLEAIASELGVSLDWSEPAQTSSIATLQKAEIARALLRGADVLILDEPTAALAPQEAERLFTILANLTTKGRTVIVITHRLRDVMDHAQWVTVMRAGRSVRETETSATSIDELASLIVGPSSGSPMLGVDTERNAAGDAEPTEHAEPPPRMPVLEFHDVTVPGRPGSAGIRNVTLTLHAGEILGIAGVDGSGQRELCHVAAGLLRPASGRIILNGREVTCRSAAHRIRAGLAFCPEDRQREGLVLPFSIWENLLLGRHRIREFGGGALLDHRTIRAIAKQQVSLHSIQAPAVDAPASILSGGNQQKVMVARALVGHPAVLVAMQPTRGLDLRAARATYDAIAAERARGMGALIVSLDLDELLEATDRIAVLFAGRIVAIVRSTDTDRSATGQMMTTGTPP